MIPVSTLRGQSVALFGLGGSGLRRRGRWSPAAPKSPPGTTVPPLASALRRQALRWSISLRPTGGASGCSCSRRRAADHPKPHWTVDLAHAAGVPIVGDVELFVRERGARAP